jgi:hypothetical protein
MNQAASNPYDPSARDREAQLGGSAEAEATTAVGSLRGGHAATGHTQLRHPWLLSSLPG